MAYPLLSWGELEDLRRRAGVSRAEISRRAGISESTFIKGIQEDRKPNNSTRKAVLDALRELGISA
jgi:DNA-binding LacI/PurR family transcriptional regulator